MESRLRTSGILIIAGLGVELASLLYSGPAAFLLFLFGGGVLLAAGILLYLFSLATHS